MNRAARRMFAAHGGAQFREKLAGLQELAGQLPAPAGDNLLHLVHAEPQKLDETLKLARALVTIHNVINCSAFEEAATRIQAGLEAIAGTPGANVVDVEEGDGYAAFWVQHQALLDMLERSDGSLDASLRLARQAEVYAAAYATLLTEIERVQAELSAKQRDSAASVVRHG